ncbi:MAG: cytochrome c biogenesis protein [Verrucomicrobiota bacterium]|nr:cytochrome c biogenesis protein [Verrucomicrobiota bacterium]
MDRQLLLLSTGCFLAAVVRTVVAMRARHFQRSRFNLAMILLGFGLQTGFLTLRGHVVGRCPITNLFEVLIFLAWSIALIYLLVGPAYRLSLMGAFTAPLVFAVQIIALVTPIDVRRVTRTNPNAWLEFHASISIIAYGAFALACVAGVMYLVQERQLKTRALHSIFYQLPPLPNLFAAMTRLLWLGFALYTAGLASGFFTGEPLPHLKIALAVIIWLIYGAILQGRYLHAVAPRRIAAWCVAAFAAALSLLWSIEFATRHA